MESKQRGRHLPSLALLLLWGASVPSDLPGRSRLWDHGGGDVPACCKPPLAPLPYSHQRHLKYNTPLFNSPFAELPKGCFQLRLKARRGAQAVTLSSHVSPRLLARPRAIWAELRPSASRGCLSFLPFPPWGLVGSQAVQGGESLTRHLSTRCLARRSQPGPLHGREMLTLA